MSLLICFNIDRAYLTKLGTLNKIFKEVYLKENIFDRIFCIEDEKKKMNNILYHQKEEIDKNWVKKTIILMPYGRVATEHRK